MVEVKIKFLPHFDESLGAPAYQSIGAAGADLKACLEDGSICVNPGKRILIPTGISVEIPVGYEWQIRPRSGLSLKTSLMIPNSPGTIDSDYRGEVMVIIANMGDEPYTINHGDRIAQAVLCRFDQAHFISVNNLDSSIRGSGGFGSTGKE